MHEAQCNTMEDTYKTKYALRLHNFNFYQYQGSICMYKGPFILGLDSSVGRCSDYESQDCCFESHCGQAFSF